MSFAALLRWRDTEEPATQLAHWMAEAASSELAEIRAFAPKLRQDQAAIHALLVATVRARGNGSWGHDFVQVEFVGQLINRRKQYPASLRDVLACTIVLRHAAECTTDLVTETHARRAVRRAREFVAAVQVEGEQP